MDANGLKRCNDVTVKNVAVTTSDYLLDHVDLSL